MYDAAVPTKASPSRSGDARERARIGVPRALLRLAGFVLPASMGTGGLVACTDGGEARERTEPKLAPAPAVPRNSDGSPQSLPPGPPSRPSHTLVLAYADFGPQALAGELLGTEWWQWEGGGSWEIDDAFDVRVVVYRGMTLAAVKAEYPTVVGKADYRYASYDEAVAYLDRSLAEIAGDPSLVRLHGELLATRARVLRALPPAAPMPGEAPS